PSADSPERCCPLAPQGDGHPPRECPALPRSCGPGLSLILSTTVQGAHGIMTKSAAEAGCGAGERGQEAPDQFRQHFRVCEHGNMPTAVDLGPCRVREPGAQHALAGPV